MTTVLPRIKRLPYAEVVRWHTKLLEAILRRELGFMTPKEFRAQVARAANALDRRWNVPSEAMREALVLLTDAAPLPDEDVTRTWLLATASDKLAGYRVIFGL
ncbi:hypothetical protein ACFU0X_35160 [Streptomyces cellulosae]|uniref:Uncharacterized protein n=1 Tax=Streptomyces cellulosae TaxID=1968 RepID=A0ABW6JS19_STRCE